MASYDELAVSIASRLAFDRLFNSLTLAAQTLVRAICDGNVPVAIVSLYFSTAAWEEIRHFALHLARDPHMTEFLISIGANVEGLNKLGETPFLYAIYEGEEEIMNVLIRKGCNIHAKDNYGDGALIIASCRGHLNIGKRLVEVGLSVNETNRFKSNSLHRAAAEERYRMVEYLISAGADMEAQNEWGRTPFLDAIHSGGEREMDFLIQNGCNIHAKDGDGDEAVAVAAQTGNINIVKKLVSLGLSVNYQNLKGSTPLHWTQAEQDKAEMTEYLISIGANIEARDKAGRTPFLLAVEMGRGQSLDVLVLRGCDVDVKDQIGWGAMETAQVARNDKVKIKRKLEDIYSARKAAAVKDAPAAALKAEDGETLRQDDHDESKLADFTSEGEEAVFQEESCHIQRIYDEALKRGSVTVNRSGIIIVGQNGAGKSCLVDSLLNQPFEVNKLSTEGAAVTMTHTKATEWVATESIDHLDSLVAESCYRVSRDLTIPASRRETESSKSAMKMKSPPDFGITAGSERLRQEMTPEPLKNDLKEIGVLVKTLTPNQQRLVDSFLRNRPSEEDLLRQGVGIRDIWDLGGQEVYLATHSALLPDNRDFSLSIYMVVTDISKSLSDRAESFYRLPNGEVIDQTSELGWIRRNEDYPLYWFGSIAPAHDDAQKTDDSMGEEEEVRPPPVFAIGTHRDILEKDKSRFPDVSAVEKWLQQQGNCIEKLLQGSNFVTHVVLPKTVCDDATFQEMTHYVKRIFLVDNTLSGSSSSCHTISKLRQRVDRMTERYWKRKKQPLFWVYLEILLFSWRVHMKTVVAKVDDISKLANAVCNISTQEEVLIALKYLANVGVILFYPDVEDLSDFVFTSPSWVIKALSTFVTASPPGPYMEPKWRYLKEKGIMTDDLLDYRLKQMRKECTDDVLVSTDFSSEQAEENKLITRLLQLLDIITPVPPELSLNSFYVPSMLRTPSVPNCAILWKKHTYESPFPAPLIFLPTKLKFIPECLYFRLITRFLRMYPKRPRLSRHQCIFLAEDEESSVEVEVELLYHSRGCWVALTVCFLRRADLDMMSSSFLASIRERLFEEWHSACRQSMRGFKYSVCCQLKKERREGEDFEIDIRSLPVIIDRNKNYQYSPKDAKLYNGFDTPLPLEEEELSSIDMWFQRQVSSAQSQGFPFKTNQSDKGWILTKAIATVADGESSQPAKKPKYEISTKKLVETICNITSSDTIFKFASKLGRFRKADDLRNQLRDVWFITRTILEEHQKEHGELKARNEFVEACAYAGLKGELRDKLGFSVPETF